MKKRKWQGIISGGLALGFVFSLQPVSAQTLVKEEQVRDCLGLFWNTSTWMPGSAGWGNEQPDKLAR